MNIQPIAETLNAIINTLTTLTQTMISMQQEINAMKDSQENKPKLPKKEMVILVNKDVPKISALNRLFPYHTQRAI